jgi:hypothetical protein
MLPRTDRGRVRTGGILVLLLACAAGASLAAIRGVVLHLGDSATGEIGPVADDADDFLVDLADGTLVTATLAAPKGSTLLPYLRFFDPEGQQALDLANYITGADKPKFMVKGYPVPLTGTWLVRVVAGSAGSAGGAYKLTLTGKPPKKAVNAGVSLTDLEVKQFPFGGHEDGAVSITLKDGSGPPLSVGGVRILGPGGDPLPGFSTALKRKGKTLVAKNVPLTDGFGEYVLEVQGPPSGGPSVFDLSIQVRLPKLQKRSQALPTIEPQVVQVDPGTGPIGGPLAIQGSGFRTGAVVWLDDTLAGSPVVLDEGNITCSIPGGPDAVAGLAVRVAVQNPDGQENGRDRAFTYAAPPRPSGVTPLLGPTKGGEFVAVHGAGFRAGVGGYVVTFGGTPATAVQVLSGTKIECRTPAAAPGSAKVVVTDEFGQVGNMVGSYLYVSPPGLASVSPGTGPATGGTVVTLTGSGFRAADRVFFGSREMSNPTLVSPTQLRVTTSSTKGGVVSVSVTDEFQETASLAKAFRFEAHMTDLTVTNLPGQGSPSAPAGREVAAGDLDGDGDRDIVIADDFAFPNASTLAYSSLHLLRNEGGLLFSDASLSSLPTGRFWSYPNVADRSWQGDSVQLGDLDGDGDLDLVVSNRDPFPASGYYKYYGGTYYYLATAGTRVLLNDGKGKFSNPANNLAAFYYSAGMGGQTTYGYSSVVIDRWQADKCLLGDLDGDGRADLVLVSSGHIAHFVANYYSYYAYTGGSSSTRVLKGNGDGTFKYLGGAVPLSPTSPYGMPSLDDFAGTDARLGDLDGDGKLDLVVTHRDLRPAGNYGGSYPASYGSSYMIGTRVLRNAGNGAFYFSYANMPVTNGFTTGSTDFLQADSIELGDLDGDGTLDLVLASQSSFYYYDGVLKTGVYRPGVRILKNDGKGRFRDATDAAWGGPFAAEPYLNARSVSIGDVDGDGFTDLVLVTTGAYVLTDGTGATRTTGTRIFLNDGTGAFHLAPLSMWPDTTASNSQGIYWTGSESFLGDLDGDGDLDFVVTNSYSYAVSGGWYTMLVGQR